MPGSANSHSFVRTQLCRVGVRVQPLPEPCPSHWYRPSVPLPLLLVPGLTCRRLLSSGHLRFRLRKRICTTRGRETVEGLSRRSTGTPALLLEGTSEGEGRFNCASAPKRAPDR